MREPDLTELAARSAIERVLSDYAWGVDRRDWDRVRSCYHADAHDDHGVYRGSIDGFVRYFSKVAASWDLTAHYVFPADIVFSGDGAAAAVESKVVAHHVRGEDDLVMGARYADRFERRDGDWRIAHRQVLVEWVRLTRNDRSRWEFAGDFDWTTGGPEA